MAMSLDRIHRFAIWSLTASAVVALGVTTAQAAPVVNFNISVNGGTGGPFSTSFSQNGDPTFTPPGVFNYQQSLPYGAPPTTGPINGPANEWSIVSWDFNADGDPSGIGGATGAKIGSGFVVKNNLPDGATPADNHLQFSIMITMNVMPSSGATTFFGSGGQVLTIDQSLAGHWGTLSATTTPVWNFMIDGGTAASLFSPGYVLGASNGPSTAGGSANLTPAQTAGLAGIHPTTMGIRLDFDLTPGETAAFTGVFGFIPGPGSLALLALSALMTRSRRRR